jgi:hypothetical protein
MQKYVLFRSHLIWGRWLELQRPVSQWEWRREEASLECKVGKGIAEVFLTGSPHNQL